MKIRFDTLTLKNFMSFGAAPITVQLDTGQSTLIQGVNLDNGDGSVSRNGVGKSVIFQALTWCLFDQGITPIKKDQFVNLRNKKHMTVTVTFSIGKDHYTITRGRKPNVVNIERNGEPYTPARDIQDEIVGILGFDWHSWTTVVMLTNENQPFMALTPAKQRDYIEQILSLDLLSERADALKARKKSVDTDIKLEQQALTIAQHDNAATQSNIDTLQLRCDQWEQTEEQRRMSVFHELKPLRQLDFDEERRRNRAHQRLLDEELAAKRAVDGAEYKAGTLALKQRWETDQQAKIADALRNSESWGASREDRVVALRAKAKHWQEQQRERVRELGRQAEIWVAEQQGEIDRLDQQLRQLEMIDIAGERERTTAVAELNARLVTLDRQINEQATAHRTTLDLIERESKERDTLASGECPYCQQAHVDADRIAALEEQIASHTQQSTDTETALRELLASEETSKVTLAELMTEPVMTIEDIERTAQRIDELRQRLAQPMPNNPYRLHFENGRQVDNPHVEQHCQVRDEINPYLDQIDDAERGDNPYTDIHQRLVNEINPYVVIGDEQSIQRGIDEARAAFDAFESKITALLARGELYDEPALAQIEARIKTLDEQLHGKVTNPYQEQLKMLKAALKPVDDSTLRALEDDESHLRVLIKLLTDNKSFVRSHLVDQYLPRINGSINHYLAVIESSHRVTVHSDLTVDVIYMDQAIGYGNLSRGEKLRVNLAVSMAFRDFMAGCGHSCNLLCIDELLDSGGDSQFMLNVFGLLKHLPTSLFLISHRDELVTELDRILTVTKENGFTRLTLAAA